MAICITSDASQKYISFLQRKGVNISEYNGNENSTGIVVYQSVSGRQVGKYASDILKKIVNMGGEPPYFIVLGLQWSKTGDKHSITLVIDGEQGHCSIHIFDSNGPLKLHKSPNNKNQIDRLYLILVSLREQLSEYYNCSAEIIDDMKDIENLNTVGQGNCDALSLWYITKYFLHPEDKKILKKFEAEMYPKNMTPKQASSNREKIINKINQDVVKLGGRSPNTKGTFFN